MLLTHPFWHCIAFKTKLAQFDNILVSCQLWYPLSKTLAEECAWKFSKDNGIDMVAINPSFVFGPLLQPTLNLSAALILNLINGRLLVATLQNNLIYLTFRYDKIQNILIKYKIICKENYSIILVFKRLTMGYICALRQHNNN